VPLVILVAWLLAALSRMLADTGSFVAPVLRYRWAVRSVALTIGVAIAVLLTTIVSHEFYRRLDKSAMTDRWGKPFERASNVTEQLRHDWDLASWTSRANRPDLVTLSLYINACTSPDDRVLVESYMPQVLALARRAFAGGHADLRPGFFETEDAQRLTLSRLQKQSVP
jgi:hypothetical protein